MIRILSNSYATTRHAFLCVLPTLSLALILLLFLVPSTPLVAMAQDSAQTYDSPAASSAPSLAPRTDLLDSQSQDGTDTDTKIDPADIPDILMQEVNRVELNCKRNYMYSSFHDCRCIAIKYLDARLKSDPQKTPDYLIYNQIAASCVDEASIAGYIYPSCYDVMQISRPETYRPFCQCVANRVARLYAAQPVVNLGYIDRLRESAFRQCGSY